MGNYKEQSKPFPGHEERSETPPPRQAPRIITTPNNKPNEKK